MKILIAILITSVTIFSCSKENARERETPAYSGIYHTTGSAKDTVYVTHQEGSRATIRWASFGTGAKIVFDSVIVAQDLTFTVNEIADYYDYHSVGTGSFGTNTISFNIVMNGNAHIVFSGVKQQ